MPSCRTCTDFTSELADISIGGAYPLEEWSTVIIRTKAGEEFFYNAVENGVISTWVIEQEPEVYERVVRAAIQKRTAALQEAKKLEEKLGYLPVLMLRESDELAKVKIEDIMTKDVKTVTENTTITQLLDQMTKQHHIGYPVVNEVGEPVGIITIEEAAEIEKEKRDKTLVCQILHKKPISVHPGDTALDAFKKMTEFETGRILVTDPADSKKMLGIVTKADLMHTLIEQS
jgi:CBS domain-containing protein